MRPEEHKLNVDPNPTVIRKKPTERAKYTQNVSLKYLKPPPPPKPGDITIEQEPDVQVPPGFLFFLILPRVIILYKKIFFFKL